MTATPLAAIFTTFIMTVNLFFSLWLVSFENDIEAESWHRDLLRRMALEINGYRPRLIDDQLYQLLTDIKKTVEWYLQKNKW